MWPGILKARAPGDAGPEPKANGPGSRGRSGAFRTGHGPANRLAIIPAARAGCHRTRCGPPPRKRSPASALEGGMTVPDGLFGPMSGEDLRLREGG